MKIDKSDPHCLTISMSRLAEIPLSVGATLLLVYWFFFIIKASINIVKRDGVSLYGILLFSLLYIPSLLVLKNYIANVYRKIFIGESYILDRQSNTFKCNEDVLINLSDISKIQSRHTYDYDTNSYYQISIVGKDGTKLMIDDFSNFRKAKKFAEHLADFIGVEIIEEI